MASEWYDVISTNMLISKTCIKNLSDYIERLSRWSNERTVDGQSNGSVSGILTASRRCQDKRGHHRSAACSRKPSWAHVAACGNMCALGTNNGKMSAIVWPFSENLVRPDPVWKPVNHGTSFRAPPARDPASTSLLRRCFVCS